MQSGSNARGAVLVIAALLATACDAAPDNDVVHDTVPSARPAMGPAPGTAADTSGVTVEEELYAALTELVSGARAADGAQTWFSVATAGSVHDVVVDSSGNATVTFADLTALIPNASSSAGSTMLLEELNATVFGVAGIESVDYTIEGSCARFWDWLQYGCQRVHRDGKMTPRVAS